MHSHERLPVVRGLDQAIVISSWLVIWPEGSTRFVIGDLLLRRCGSPGPAGAHYTCRAAYVFRVSDLPSGVSSSELESAPVSPGRRRRRQIEAERVCCQSGFTPQQVESSGLVASTRLHQAALLNGHAV